jgi:hypothetical protein
MRNGTLRALAALALALAVGACAGKAPPGMGDDDDDDDDTTKFPDASVPSTPDAALAACEGTDPGGFTFDKIATWKDDAKAAYSFIHDDMCDSTVAGIYNYALPQLAARGIRAGAGVIAGECDDDDGWAKVADEEMKGMEIVNHSFSHPQIDATNQQHEVVEAKQLIDSHILKKVTFFIFPFDFFSPTTIATVTSAGHLGARAGNRDDNDGFDHPPVSGSEPDNDYAVEFDVWPRSFSKYALYYPEDVLQVHVWNAIKSGGWAMREFHSVIPDAADPATNGFGPVPLTIYTKHLDFLQKAWATGQVWTGAPSEVIRYRHARKACKASISGTTIKFDSSSSECQKYATPISVIVKTSNDVPRVDGKQDGVLVETRKLAANTYSISADPTKGDVELSGCSNEGPVVDTSTQLDPMPSAANSVCDIQKAVGSGSPGMMDNLERPEDEFQALPNPSNGDGRDGTWSWYPQTASVKMEAEGSNHFVHYTGSALNAWSGVTLAFMNSNGAGACYDASAYHGIRFKIKGTVNDTMLNNKVIVSLVTAETQTRTYGGDLVGEGGHFNKQIAVTGSWQTVSIAWAEFDKPTWGATTTLTAVAKNKLQAIDFGVSNTASTFDLELDDLELY